MKRLENVEMINVVIDRDFYMKHGQYMNTRGKEKNVDENSLYDTEYARGIKWNLSV